MPSLSWIFASIFGCKQIAGYQQASCQLGEVDDETLEFGELIIFEGLGISGPFCSGIPLTMTYIYMLKSNQKLKPSAKTLQTPKINVQLNSHMFAPSHCRWCQKPFQKCTYSDVAHCIRERLETCIKLSECKSTRMIKDVQRKVPPHPK